MFADSGGGNKNGTEGSQQDASRDLRRATSLLRLLKSSDEDAIADPEIREEFQRLHELLERIDRIAEGVESGKQSPEDVVHADVERQPAQSASERTPPTQDAGPAEASVPPGDRALSEETRQAEPEPGPAPQAAGGQAEARRSERASSTDEHLARWWINFNGDVSLERLSRLRALLDESPFTIDTRYDEITDGLIVLRVVTDQHITMDQLDWILRQLMDLVGLDRKSAIISKH